MTQQSQLATLQISSHSFHFVLSPIFIIDKMTWYSYGSTKDLSTTLLCWNILADHNGLTIKEPLNVLMQFVLHRLGVGWDGVEWGAWVGGFPFSFENMISWLEPGQKVNKSTWGSQGCTGKLQVTYLTHKLREDIDTNGMFINIMSIYIMS